MKIDGEKHRLAVTKSDISGSTFNDVNLSGATLTTSICRAASITTLIVGLRFHDVNMSAGAFTM